MKYRISLILATVILFTGCSPDIAEMEEDFHKKMEAAFRDQSLEQIITLRHFQDEPEEVISQWKERWNQRLEREVESISFEAIPNEIQNSYSVGYEMEGRWYEPVPNPYKSVVIKYKNKGKSDDGSFLSAGIRTLVAIDGHRIVIPGMKLMEAMPKYLRIVLPNEFEGKFSVVWLESGTTAKETEEALTYKIPRGGELAVTSLDHFMQDRPMLIEYESGSVIYAEGSDKTGADDVYFDPSSKTVATGSIGAPEGTSSTEYHGTKLSWEIKQSEPAGAGQPDNPPVKL